MMVKLGVLAAVAVFLETVSGISLGVVQTEGGKVQGQNIVLGSDRYMDVFKGIPFAAVPGMFEKPKRHPGWRGTLRTTEMRNKCLQVNLFMTFAEGSEDCLYLNIWVPHGSTVSSGLPVMVWIFGGAFLVGDTLGFSFKGKFLYSGQEIADRGRVIVVTLSYRVGTLGFLSTGDSSLPGNYGLWDQQAAIAWVHRNIRSFGGDPNNISIFGFSAGGASVNFQILTPYNKGLIKRAISQSGVALCPWAINRNPRKIAEQVAKKVNCPTDNTMAECLKRTNPVTLTMAGTASLSGSPYHPIVYNLVLSPVIDGDFLPSDPSKLFENAADIDYIAGVNNMDGYIFAAVDVPSINFALLYTSVEDLRNLLTSFTKEKGQAGSNLAYSMYTSNWGSSPSQETIKKTVVDVETDYIILAPTQAALYLHAAKASTGRTYSYVFSEPSNLGGLGKLYPRWKGADHTDEVEYVLGKPFTTPQAYTNQDREVSSYMITYWTNFAKTGDPNSGASVPVDWPEFTSTENQYLEINSKMDTSYVRQELRLPYVQFWTMVLPSFATVTSE